MKNKYRLHVNVQIVNELFGGAGLSINDETLIECDSFADMAKILEAFHTLVEEFRERSDAPRK